MQVGVCRFHGYTLPGQGNSCVFRIWLAPSVKQGELRRCLAVLKRALVIFDWRYAT